MFRIANFIATLGTAGFLSTAAAADLDAKLTFSIPAQTLSAALFSFADQAGIQVMTATADLANVNSRGVTGERTAREALSVILEGTGLKFRVVSDNAVTIEADGPRAVRGNTVSSNGAGAGTLRLTQASAVAIDASSAAGQNPQDKQDPRNAPGASQGDKLEEIVVTAQKREERLQNVPISMTVLRGADLDQSTVQGVSEALNKVPGVATQQNYLGSGTIVVVRGAAPARPFGAGASPVAYYLDSVPFGLVRSGMGPDSNAFDLERIEVLRGPQGTLYGASALSGVVRVLTHDVDLSRFELKTRISGSATEQGGNNYRGDVAANFPIIQDKLAVRAIAGYQNDSGWIDQPNKKDANDARIQTYRLKIDARPTQELAIGLSAWSSRNDTGAPSVGRTVDQEDSVLDQPTATDYDAYGLKIGYQFPALSLSSATSYLDYANEGSLGLDVPFFNAPNSIFFTGIDSTIFSQEFNLNSSLEGAWRWSAGGMYRRATEKDLTYFTGLYGVVPGNLSDSTSKSYAVFGELTRLFLQGRLELTVGLRHFRDDVSQDAWGNQGFGTPLAPTGSETGSYTANTPRGVITWHPSQRQTVYASFSQGFRSGFPQIGLPVGFPTVRPDKLRNYEVGTKGSLAGGALTYDASVYYMDWQDIHLFLGVPYVNNLRVQAVVNGASASGMGTDLSVSVEPAENLVLNASLSWNNLELDGNVMSDGLILFNEGDRSSSSPEMTAGTSAQYSFALAGNGLTGRIAASAHYTSSQAYRNILGGRVVVQDGDSMLLARASFSIDSPRNWTATLYADNINNEKGAPVKAFIGVDNWNARIRPRTVGLQLQYEFGR